ncbi:MAG: molybdopterin cofactor-binding domain-containing protein [Burkholderiaceae bacterium]
MVRVTYAADDAVLDFDAASGSASTPPKFGKGKADTMQDDVEAALRAAGTRIGATYETPMVHHNPMEPHATIAVWDGDQPRDRQTGA